MERLYRLAFQRAPEREEVLLAKQFLARPVTSTNTIREPVTWQYGYGEFDETTSRVKQFKALPHFTGSAWQGGKEMPDKQLGWVILNAEGGHVGNDLQHAAIRRWHAPHAGVIKIRGQLAHTAKSGDGVRGRVVSSSAGEAAQWIAHNSKATTNVERIEVKRGDTIDFVVDL